MKKFRLHGSMPAQAHRFCGGRYLVAILVCIFGTGFHSFASPAASLPVSCATYAASGAQGHRLVAESSMVTTGTVSLTYLRVRYPDEPPEPVSLEEARRDLVNATALLDSISSGQCHLQWSISPVLTLPKSREAYGTGDAFNDLLSDARAAAKEVGIDYLDYQLDIVRHTGAAGLASGSANLGRRGLQLSVSGWFILLHEIGHNFGLYHANLWNTLVTDVPSDSPPLPSDFKRLQESTLLPVHPNSLLGEPNLTGPGTSLEYGDPWDLMGSGAVQFSVPNRLKLGWLQDEQILRVTESSTHRLYASDVTSLLPGRTYGLRIPTGESPLDREVWVEIAPADEVHPDPGLIIRWAKPEASVGTDLLQPSVGFIHDPRDRMVSLGETFSDRFRNLHITPVALGGTEQERWFEVVVARNPAAPNRPPTLLLTADHTTVNPGDPVELVAVASDLDGDTLSWRWDLDDGTHSIQPAEFQKRWTAPGDYLVQVEVSDLKGGVGRAHLAVTVGKPDTARIVGRVTDDKGDPIPGARVHALTVDGKNRTLRWMLTDSEGRYTLTQLGPGTYTNGAFAFGFATERVPPLQLDGPEIAQQNYHARQLPQLLVSSPAILSEGSGWVNVFTLTRSGVTTEPWNIPFHLSGTAEPGRHYEEPTNQVIHFPAGARSTTLALNLLDVPGVEDWKTIRLNIEIPTESQHLRSDGTSFIRFYPGYDIEWIDRQPFWTLTNPLFVPGPSAEVIITDDDLRLGVESVGQEPGLLTLRLRGEPGMVVELESSTNLRDWIRVSTQQFPRTGSSDVRIPSEDARRFYRLRLPQAP